MITLLIVCVVTLVILTLVIEAIFYREENQAMQPLRKGRE